MNFRIWIDTDSNGLGAEAEHSLATARAVLLTNLERDITATWLGDERPKPGRRYIYVLDAKSEAEAESVVRGIVGDAPHIRVFRHGQRDA